MNALSSSVESANRCDMIGNLRDGELWPHRSRITKGIRATSSCIRGGYAVGVIFLVFAAGVICAPVSSYAQQPTKSDGVAKPSNEVLEKLVLQFTNNERRQRGIPPLRFSPALRYVARQHSANMCRTSVFEHEDGRFPKGWETFGERLGRVGLDSGGENIGYRTLGQDLKVWARQAVNGWMKSTSHRRNILDPRFRYLGVGIRPCENGLGYATQVFSPAHGNPP